MIHYLLNNQYYLMLVVDLVDCHVCFRNQV
jgi:hypothetical protein